MSQIVSVADIYEAITGARSYQAPTLPEHACLILARLAGEKLNTALVKAFVNAITFFPLGPNRNEPMAWNDIWGWAIPKTAPAGRKALAKKMLSDMMLDEEGQRELWKRTGAPPTSPMSTTRTPPVAPGLPVV